MFLNPPWCRLPCTTKNQSNCQTHAHINCLLPSSEKSWKCFPLLLWKRACASFVPPPGFLASQPGLDKFLARAARSGCFGEELESSSSCILTVRKWNWMLFKLRQKIRTKGLAVCTMCTHLSHPIQMIHPLHSEQTKYAWCSKKCKMCGHVRRFKRCCLFKLIRRFHKPQKLNVI